VITSFRVFGDAGALADNGGKIDVIANGGGGLGGDATLILNGPPSQTQQRQNSDGLPQPGQACRIVQHQRGRLIRHPI